MNDLRYALRSLRNTPGFSALAVGILGLGLGVNSTIFTLVSTLLLQPPPGIGDPERLVRMNRQTENTRAGSLAYPDYVFYRAQSRAFTGIAAYASGGGNIVLANTGADAIEVRAQLVSANYFDVLQAPLAAGRAFLPDEDRVPGTSPVLLLSHRFWQSHLGGDASAVGRRLTINGHPFTIVGVMGPAFRMVGPAEAEPDVWLPITMQPVVAPAEIDLLGRVPDNVNHWIQVIGRLAPGVSAEAGQAELAGLAKRLEEEFPSWNEGIGVTVTPHFAYSPAVRDRVASGLRLLMAAAGAVLLIACANLALLLLARASARRKEVGVRIALGAGRWRIASRLLYEGLLLSLAGCAVGLLLATWVSQVAASFFPVAVRAAFTPGVTVIGISLGVAVLTSVAFGVAPAWVAARSDVVVALKEGAPGSGRSRLRNTLVAVQVGLSLVLVAGAGLFVRSLVRAQRVELGFETHNRLLLTVNLRDFGYTEATAASFIHSALQRLAALPGVQSVTTTRMVALGGGRWETGFGADGATPPPGEGFFQAGANTVGPDYFRTMGIPLIAGRDFRVADDRSAVPVVIINEALARMLWGNENPIGRVIIRNDSTRSTVIGLARNARYYDLDEEPQPQIYFSQFQLYNPPVTLVVHTAVPPAGMVSSVRRELLSLDPDLAVAAVRSYEDVMRNAVRQFRMVAALVSLFGALALVLAGVGLYGVLAYLVVQSRREIAVRMALGAQRRQVAARVLGRGLALAVIGIGVGTAAAVPLSRLVRSFLFGVEPGDPLTLGGTAAVLLGVAALASYLPARRAARVDPMHALRYE